MSVYFLVFYLGQIFPCQVSASSLTEWGQWTLSLSFGSCICNTRPYFFSSINSVTCLKTSFLFLTANVFFFLSECQQIFVIYNPEWYITPDKHIILFQNKDFYFVDRKTIRMDKVCKYWLWKCPQYATLNSKWNGSEVCFLVVPEPALTLSFSMHVSLPASICFVLFFNLGL